MRRLYRSGVIEGLISYAIVLALWYLMLATGAVSEAILPSPWTVFKLGYGELADGRLIEFIGVSGVRLIHGFAIGATLGILLGAALGLYRTAYRMFFPVFEILRPIPPLAWVPLAMIWFGLGEASKVFLIALTVFFPVFITSMKGVQHLDFALFRAALSLDVGPWRMFFSVTLPAAMPDILTGLRLGWSMGLVALVGAEMIASDSGLGYLIMDGMNKGRFDFVILGILTIGALSIVTDAIFIRFSRSRLLRWHRGLEQREA